MGWFSDIFGIHRKSKENGKMAKKYDIIVRENDLDGKTHIHKESGVMANSAKELAMLYARCDQTIQIEREYEDDESRNYGKRQNGIQINNQTNTSQTSDGQRQEQQFNPVHNASTPRPPIQIEAKHEPPKYFDIGGIKCKMENGKMYQKQWMRLSDAEAAEFRIVSDKNNKICPIKDRHIEVMKWILVQDENENNTESEGKVLLNG